MKIYQICRRLRFNHLVLEWRLSSSVIENNPETNIHFFGLLCWATSSCAQSLFPGSVFRYHSLVTGFKAPYEIWGIERWSNMCRESSCPVILSQWQWKLYFKSYPYLDLMKFRWDIRLHIDLFIHSFISFTLEPPKYNMYFAYTLLLSFLLEPCHGTLNSG